MGGDSYRVKGCINPGDDFESDDVALMIASQFPVLAPADRFELVLEGEKIDMQGEEINRIMTHECPPPTPTPDSPASTFHF